MEKILLTKEQQELIKTGNMIKLADNSTYYYLPYWFKATGDSRLFEIHQLDHLPKELKDTISSLKNRVRNIAKNVNTKKK